MNSRTDKALSTFRSGLNCSQAVLTAYSDDLNFDNGLALNISSGFGAGMGRLQETCGAVTGAYMVLSIYNGNQYENNILKKEESYLMIQKFSESFKQIHGSSDCKRLLNCDLRTEEGNNYAKENNLFEIVCEKCISDSINIVNKLLYDLH